LLLYCFSKEGILIVFTWFGLIRFLVWFISPRLTCKKGGRFDFFFLKKRLKTSMLEHFGLIWFYARFN
jgi:hypothetical protein